MASDGECRGTAAVGLGALLCIVWLVAGCGKAVCGPLAAPWEAFEKEAHTQPAGGAPVVGLDPPPTLWSAHPAAAGSVATREESTAAEDDTAGEPQIPITNRWLGTPVRDILDDVAFNSGIQLFVSDSGVCGSLSLSVENMPFEDFLDNVTSSVGATYRRLAPRTYFVGSFLPRDPSFPRVSESVTYQVNYVAVGRLRELMPRWTVEYVTFGASAPYMTITAPQVFLEEILRIVKSIDRP